ncbi:50S ribosomal protein L37ae [Candidatus Marsarchaeota archaeon]|jgi:Ribosomal protein L37AE/L43A|nr:50S ribosomal protein L37ae [Candidatus Marsarchaeota archaeon]MCL5090006.1 50S ribosomal protein L37ae [Candidatus Marsarchaeota archaeon]
MANSGIRNGAGIRKQYMAVQKVKNASYKCPSCGSVSVKRVNTGIWKCTHCDKIYSGGAYIMSTPPGEISRKLIKEIEKKKINENK